MIHLVSTGKSNCRRPAEVIVVDQLVLAGGWGPAAHTDFVDAWLPGSAAWDEVPPLSVARAGACGATLGDALYVVGGGVYEGAGVWQSVDAVDVLRAH